MFTLSCTSDAAPPIRVPVSERHVLRFVAACLEPEASLRQEYLATLLNDCPLLATWGCAAYAADQQRLPSAVADAARWLAEHGLALFVNSLAVDGVRAEVPLTAGASEFSVADAEWARQLPAVLTEDASEHEPMERADADADTEERERAVLTLLEMLVRREAVAASITQRLHEAKLSSLREFAYGATHELNNPLANISSRAQSLLRDETHPERRRALATIHRQALRAHEMLADMMLFAKPPALRESEFDLVAVARQALAELAEQAAAQHATLRLATTAPQLMVRADREQCLVAIKALLRNSLEALDTPGDVLVSLEIPDEGDTGVRIRVLDTGPGISAAAREHVFDPFFSGREAGRGLGFGLAKTWRIVAQHGGSLDWSNRPAGGCVFAIRLPGARCVSGPPAD